MIQRDLTIFDPEAEMSDMPNETSGGMGNSATALQAGIIGQASCQVKIESGSLGKR